VGTEDLLFRESFEDSNSQRGWYDGDRFRIVGDAGLEGLPGVEWTDSHRPCRAPHRRRLFEPTRR